MQLYNKLLKTFKIIIKKIFFYFRMFFFAKWNFFAPRKNNLLIFDRENSQYINRIFKKKAHILDVRGEQFNFVVLFKTLMGLKFNKFYYHYQINYIKSVNPDLIISGIDTSSFYLNLKKYFPNKKIILLQSSKISNYTGVFLNILKKINIKKKFRLDYFFVTNESSISLFKKYIDCKFIVHGSFKNNFIPKKINITKKFGLISQVSKYGEKKFLSNLKNIIYIEKFFEKYTEELVKNFIKIFPKEILYVIPYNFIGSKDFIYEKKFLLDLGKNYKLKIKIFNKSKPDDAYKYLDKLNILFGLNSTLLYEAFARNKKILYCNSFLNEKIKGYEFGWPNKKLHDSHISIKRLNFQDFKKKLNNLVIMSDNKLNKYYKKIKIDIMEFDNGNQKLIKTIKKLI